MQRTGFITEPIFSKEFFGELQAEVIDKANDTDSVNNLNAEFKNILMTLDRVKKDLIQKESQMNLKQRMVKAGINLTRIDKPEGKQMTDSVKSKPLPVLKPISA